MRRVYTAGRYCYAIAMIGFGCIHVISGQFMKALFPSMPVGSFLVYLIGILFILTGTGMLINRWARHAAIAAAVLFLLLLLYPHLYKFIGDLYDPNEWTVFFEIVACCAGALMIAGSYRASRTAWMMAAGRYAFACSLLVFGIQHFIYADFIQTLIPSWMPAPLVWSWLIRIAFIATAISVIIGIMTQVAAFLTGTMFILWIILLHGPRVAGNVHVEAEWTSLFIALAMGGASLLVAALSTKTIPATIPLQTDST